MKITADTPDTALLSGVEAAREHLATLLTERASAGQIAAAALTLCTAEGEAAARSAYRGVLRSGGDQSNAERALVDILLNGADDTWSGRGNDAKRARYDGFRAESHNLIHGW